MHTEHGCASSDEEDDDEEDDDEEDDDEEDDDEEDDDEEDDDEEDDDEEDDDEEDDDDEDDDDEDDNDEDKDEDEADEDQEDKEEEDKEDEDQEDFDRSIAQQLGLVDLLDNMDSETVDIGAHRDDDQYEDDVWAPYTVYYGDLEKALLDFCLTLLEQTTKQKTSDLVLVRSCAVIGLKDRFAQPPKYFSSVLSQIIKVARMLILQKSCNKDQDASRRLSATDYAKELGVLRVVQLRIQHFGYHGTWSALDSFLKLRQYAIKISFSTTADGSVHWSADGKILIFKELTINMDRFKLMVSDLIANTTDFLCRKLFFGIMQSDIPTVP